MQQKLKLKGKEIQKLDEMADIQEKALAEAQRNITQLDSTIVNNIVNSERIEEDLSAQIQDLQHNTHNAERRAKELSHQILDLQQQLVRFLLALSLPPSPPPPHTHTPPPLSL